MNYLWLELWIGLCRALMTPPVAPTAPTSDERANLMGDCPSIPPARPHLRIVRSDDAAARPLAKRRRVDPLCNLWDRVNRS